MFWQSMLLHPESHVEPLGWIRLLVVTDREHAGARINSNSTPVLKIATWNSLWGIPDPHTATTHFLLISMPVTECYLRRVVM